MNFTETLANNLIKNIELIVKVREKSIEEAFAIAREESCAGPAVWAIVNKHFNIK